MELTTWHIGRITLLAGRGEDKVNEEKTQPTTLQGFPAFGPELGDTFRHLLDAQAEFGSGLLVLAGSPIIDI
jgi:hypothetical protein